MFTLKKIPLPPSSNQIYASVRGRLIKSQHARIYSNQCQIWALKNFKLLDMIKDHYKSETTLEVNYIFVFHKQRLVGKKNQIKKLDAANRIKVIQDELAKMIGIDDSLFLKTTIEKVTCESESDQQVIIEIKAAELKSYEGLK